MSNNHRAKVPPAPTARKASGTADHSLVAPSGAEAPGNPVGAQPGHGQEPACRAPEGGHL
jgi:hypothetical protein